MTRSFYDPKTLELELARVWKKCWLLACHESRLQDPGDFAALDVGPLSALVLRDAAGGVRAFANVCPHRGARLCDGTGSARSVTCPYHAFRFGLDGKLLGAAWYNMGRILEAQAISAYKRSLAVRANTTVRERLARLDPDDPGVVLALAGVRQGIVAEGPASAPLAVSWAADSRILDVAAGARARRLEVARRAWATVQAR